MLISPYKGTGAWHPTERQQRDLANLDYDLTRKMVDSLEDNAEKYRLLLNAKPNTLKMIAFTAACTLEGLKKSVSLLIRSIDEKSVSMLSATAAMRNFSGILIDCLNFYIKRLAPYVETVLIKLQGPVLIKVWKAGLSQIYHKHKDKPGSISDCLCEPRNNLFMTFSASRAHTRASRAHTNPSHTQTCFSFPLPSR